MKVTVIHNQTATTPDRMQRYYGEHEDGCLGMFFNFCGGCIARVAYRYDSPTADLNDIYRANNRVDGSEVEVVPSTSRSLSVGDVVVLHEGRIFYGGKAYKVCNFGFEEVDMGKVLSALSNDPPKGFVL